MGLGGCPSQVRTLGQEWMQKAYGPELANAKVAAERALEELKQKCGGANGGESWKAKLSDAASWTSVLQTAAYHFNPVDAEVLTKQLDDLMKKVEKSYKLYEDVAASAYAEVDRDFEEAKRTTSAEGRATHSEAYFIDVLSGRDSPDAKSQKIQKRVAQMTKQGIGSDKILQQIWDKVSQLM
jgi:hypothetical protein